MQPDALDGQGHREEPLPWRNARDPRMARAFVDYLQDKGDLDEMASERAVAVQTQSGERIDLVLSQLGLISDQALLEALADFCRIPLVTLDTTRVHPQASTLTNTEFLRRNRVVLFAGNEDQVVVAVSDPFAKELADAVAYSIERPVSMVLMSVRDMDLALARLYGTDELDEVPSAGEESRAGSYEDDIQSLRDMASEAPIIRLVHRLIISAVDERASDIHIEPGIDCVRVRFRVDGVMHEVERLSPDTQAGVATRIKILGKLNIAERRLPQDGRATFVVGGRELDLRISTAPVLHGESVVLRILDPDIENLDFPALGFDRSTEDGLSQLLRQPNGTILVTGPTGSGKTTTLYSALARLNSVERKIFTVEDPIEYQLPGINQMQVKPQIGLDFVGCLRSILRQDPDIIMIGEMRDSETARTAIRAALTGHLVLSTLHTNNAAASVIRLLDMGVEDFLLASSLSGVLAQRLVRRLCQDCAMPLARGDAENLYNRLIGEIGAAHDLPPLRLKRPVGCSACKGSGFRGRTTISELLVIDDELRAAIKRVATDREIEDLAKRRGMQTLYQNGLDKVFGGETTIEEVLRATRV
ncbi:GspE/PulE family protein [Hyphomicrobium sp.]|uniref:GspE/PulE family protein n=1 Tax=Hyphomicrobium sp. TaxID=82 RepID=UPI003F71C0D2